MAAFQPTDLTDKVQTLLTAEVGDKLPSGSKIDHYAGEFLSLEQLEKLKSNVKQHHHFLVDMETIAGVEGDENGSDIHGQEPKLRHTIVVYSCASSYFSESSQWQSSYTGAYNAWRTLQGKLAAAVSGASSAGRFFGRDIEREFHDSGLSVHTLRVEIMLTVNTQA